MNLKSFESCLVVLEKYISDQSYEEALLYSEKMLNAFGKRVEIVQNRAFIFSYLGRYEDAIKEINNLIELCPNVAVPYEQRAGFYMKIGDFKSALKDYNKAQQYDDGYLSNAIIYFRALCYMQLKEYDNAIADLDSLPDNYCYMPGLESKEDVLAELKMYIRKNIH